MLHSLCNMIRRSNSLRSSGFTIVELIVVIVVISILAAVTVFAYNSVREETIKTTLNEDARNGASKIESYKANNGRYPSSIYDLNNGAGISASGTNYYRYVETGYYEFCIEASTENNEYKSAYYSETDEIKENEACPAVQDL